jgi:hypothetical protein
MQDRNFHIRISPEVINRKKFLVNYNSVTISPTLSADPCCNITTTTTTTRLTGLTYTYSSMTQILSGGTDGTSLLTGLTIPIMLTETATDMGYYSVFDGLILQKDILTNFIFSGDPTNPSKTLYLYNTSDNEFKKYLEFSNYQIDWGDNTPLTTISPYTSTPYIHTYSTPGEFTVSMSGLSPWSYNIVQKTVYVPFTGVTVDNLNGTAYFIPLGGSWSGTPLSYDYIFSGDSSCDVYDTNPYLDGNVIITGYTKSSLNDLRQYGLRKFKVGEQVTGSTGVVGIYKGISPDGLSSGYTINGIDYYDYEDGTTLFVVSGITPIDVVCSAITKEEYLINVVDSPDIQSAVFIERGKVSVLEKIMRLGEVDNIGDLTKYGYGFFKVTNT